MKCFEEGRLFEGEEFRCERGFEGEVEGTFYRIRFCVFQSFSQERSGSTIRIDDINSKLELMNSKGIKCNSTGENSNSGFLYSYSSHNILKNDCFEACFATFQAQSFLIESTETGENELYLLIITQCCPKREGQRFSF